MARIRTIKPEFPLSESIGRLSRDARLLFIQLWTVCDDEGRTRAASRVLASLLYPFDEGSHRLIVGWLDELEKEGLITRYEVDGSSYLEVVTWKKHQKIDRPTPSRLPSPANSTSPREPSRSLDAVPRTVDLGSRIMDQVGSGVEIEETGLGNDDAALIANSWNLMAEDHGLPQVKRITPGRRQKIKDRAKDAGGLIKLVEVIEQIPTQPFLLGKNQRGWKADLDWILEPRNFVKLEERKFANGHG